MIISNPFGSSMTLRDPTQFFGRVDTLDYLYAEITARHCVSIVGTRRIGKSSLLRCMGSPVIQNQFKDHDLTTYLLVYIDLGEFLEKSRSDFFFAVCSQLITHGKNHLHLEFPQDVSGGEAFSLLLDAIQEQGFYPVLLLDAFHQVTKNTQFDAGFFSFLRAQANHGRVSYVTASAIPLDQCCHPYIEGSPFFNIFSVHRLGPLAENEAHQLLAASAQLANSAFTPEEETLILQLAGRHPFFLQRAAFFFYRARHQENRSFAATKAEIYEDLFPHFKHIWESSLNSEQREYLKEAVRWKNVQQGRLPELRESELFRRFIRNVCDIRRADLTEEYLEKVLNDLGNTKSLGECELTHLYLFFAHAHHSVVPRSANEKGTIVRRILKDARDRLRPTDDQPQSDTAPEWQNYNFLQYRYFSGSMKNEILATRLGMSVRNLHRIRQQAIEALHAALYEMEHEARQELDASYF